jgi:hypothetical protein
LESLLTSLPAQLKPALAQILGSEPGTSIQELAQDLERWLQDAVRQTISRPAQAPEDSGQTISAETLLARFQTLLSQHPDLTPKQSDGLLALIRNLFANRENPQNPTPQRLPSTHQAGETTTTTPKTALPPNPTRIHTETASSPGTGIPGTEKPETWETWIHGSLETLSNPGLSPREAPFHIVQSKEGTAFFEIPLPHSHKGNLQIWVESDAREEQASPEEPVRRILLGLHFTQLGETRLGLAKGPEGFQVRVWAEHAELLEPDLERMKSELKSLGRPVDLRIQSLPPNTPSIRALVAGPSLQAMG